MSVDLTGRTVLVVDDDEVLSERLALSFTRHGLPARHARSYEEAMALARAAPPDLAVLDLRMPDTSGLILLRELMALRNDTLVIILSGYGSIPTAIDAVRHGAVDFVQKPADAETLIAAFERALESEPFPEPEPDYDPPSLARVEWEHIQRVLEDCGGNVSRAARMLGLHRRTLQRKLQKYPPRR